jgi:hypothetical protein
MSISLPMTFAKMLTMGEKKLQTPHIGDNNSSELSISTASTMSKPVKRCE